MNRFPFVLLLLSSTAAAAGAADSRPRRPDRPCSTDEVRTARRDGEQRVTEFDDFSISLH